MYRLKDIQSTVQQTAEAIAEVLKIEVEIADADLVRVAGTGNYHNRFGQVMSDGFVYRHVLQTGRAVVIENPGDHELCVPCQRHGSCFEDAEVASPITVNGKTIGIIGLVSFDPEQTKRLLDNKQSLLRFLEKMAELIAGKVVEHCQSQQRELIANQLETVVNLLNDGILVVDSRKIVTHFNSLAGTMLDIVGQKDVFLEDLLEGSGFWRVVEKGQQFSGQVNGKRVPVQLFCSAFPISTMGRVEGAVITLKDIQQVKKLVKDVTVHEVDTNFSQILGNSHKLKELKETALRVARGSSTVLIQGESGTGKEMFARAIHQSSDRKNHSFIAINCGAIPENLLESELFGYEEGAFTGAKKGGKLGKFELAHHGTIFLDEIGDMSLHLQVKLLRVLQERFIERIGSNRSIPIDVRVIAATHRDLEQLITTGEFREDLYYRLNVIPLSIPPLRERIEDIPLLTRYFIEYYCRLFEKTLLGITREAQAVLMQYSWPGNVRELANVIEYAITMATGDYIGEEILPARIKNDVQPSLKGLSLNLKDLEREAIVKALEQVGGDARSKEMAAKLLGISRATLYRKIKEHEILERTSFV